MAVTLTCDPAPNDASTYQLSMGESGRCGVFGVKETRLPASLPPTFEIPASPSKSKLVMMVSEKEKGRIRRFVKGQLRDGPDLRLLTLGKLKKRYLAQEGCESLSSEARQFMKQVVGEELAKMQVSDGGESEPEVTKPKRKREREKEELESDAETESAAKKSRSGHKDSPSDSEDEQICETGSQNKEQISSRSTSEEEEESEHEKSKKTGQHVTTDESSDEKIMSENGRDESPEEKVKRKANTAKNGEISIDSGGRNKTARSDEESESEADRPSEKSAKINDDDSSADGKENEKKRNDSDSDSSSLPSVDDEQKSSPAETNDKKQKKTKTGGSKDEEKAVVRLKRYITLCGVWRNYKKLLDGCRSTRSKVAVLKQELKDLGVHGNPSIEKCKRIRLKREEAQELAELDVNNIITTEGRPKRRGTPAMQMRKDPPSSYQRTLNSESDSDQKSDPHKGRRKISEWANLHGIISDDADSD